MQILNGINPLAVAVATVAYYIIGFLWYTRFFGEAWRAETGQTGAATPPSPGALLGQFISTMLFTLGIAILLHLMDGDGVAGGVAAAVVATVFFAIPINTGNLFFTGKTRLFLIDVGERAFGSVVVGVILALWR